MKKLSLFITLILLMTIAFSVPKSITAKSGEFAEIGDTEYGSGLFLWGAESITYPYFGIIKYPDNSGIGLYDKNGKGRMSIEADGEYAVFDNNWHPVVWSNAERNFTQLHLPSNIDNAIGVDETGSYQITAGIKKYLTPAEIRIGISISSSSRGGDTVVNFYSAFSGIPVVCANSIDGSYTCRIKSISETGFIIVISGENVTFNYIAVYQ